MRIVFLGTPDFAVAPLKAVCSIKNAEVVAVVCNNDKPVGRKQILTPPPTKVCANEMGISVFQYDKIRKEGVEDLKHLNPDLMITCAFGQILSQEILDIPKLGVINIHASLLPAYRGASPIQYAILNGEKTTGITIMKTDIGIDTGDILFQKEIKIGENETCGELFDRLSLLGAECIKDALPLIMSGSLKPIKQDESLASYSKMIKKEHALIDWNFSAERIINKIRAFNPFPVAYTFLNGLPFKIYKAEKCDFNGKPGTVVNSENRLIVATGSGAVSLLTVCKAGGKIMNISDFLRGNPIAVGDILG